jgi:hypothetical protein
MASKHPGFKAVQAKIGKKYGMKAAGAILASATRHASAAAKKKNPKLKRVKMGHSHHAPHHTPSTHPSGPHWHK